METVVALVPPSNNSSSNSKNIKTVANSSEVGGGGHHTSGSTSCSASSTTTDMTTSSATKPNPSSPSSSTPLNNSSNSTNSNPIFVITNSSSSSSVATSSNNLEMPSNSCAEPVVTSSGGGSGAQCEDDEGGGGGTKGVSGTVGVNGGGSNGVTSTTTAASTTSSTGQQRPSNPRQSTLTRSHAITLDEDSDGQQPSPSLISASGEPAGAGTKVLPQEQEQDLIQFIIDTCNKSAKDKSFILRIEVDLTQFVKDESRHTLPFPQMTSYQRMLVHRMATLFDLDHNVDTSSGGNFVVVSKDKDLNGGRVGRGGRLPPIRFKEQVPHPSNNPAMIVSTSSSHIATSSIDPNTEVINNDPSSLNTLNSAPSAINPSSKKILKREKPNSGSGSGADKKAGPTKTKSLEERTQDYHKARRRIFEDSAGESGSGISLDNSVSASASSKKLNWSSTDSSEDRMYLKPPFPTSGSGGKLIKVESFESASQKKPSNRDSRAMGKSHSFGGYEDSQQQHPMAITNTGGGGGRPGKNFGGGAGNNNSNNASSSMISCSSSSSLRSSSFSKQDSSSSTTSGSGQSPSGGGSSGSTSGYKSSSSSGGGGGVVTGYYTGVGANGGGMGHMGAMGQMGPVTMQPDVIKSPPSIIFAPAAGTVTPQQHHMAHQTTFYQTEDVSGTPVSSSQQVVFCCWAVTDLNNVPPGAMIIDPNTGQAIKNTDGTQYYYDPNNPPKFIQTLPVSQPPPPTTPQQEVSAYATAQPAMYPPAVLAGPPISAYAPVQTASAQTPSNTQPTTYMTVPTAGTAGIGSQIYFQPTASPGSDQDLSGYFSQLSVAGSGGGRSAPASVIYVPVDALSATATYASPASDPQQQATGYYDETQGAQSQQPQAVPVQFQTPPAAGYVLQSMVDPNGGAAGNASGGVYYYGGNLVQAPTAVQTVAAATATSTNGNSNQQHQQPRFKNWIVPHHASQHHPHQTYSLHGASSQVAPNAGAPPQQQCNQPSAAAAGSTIMIHSNAPPNSMVSAGPAGLVSVPAMLPPPHPGALQQQQQAQQQSSQPSQQNSALVPLSYHPSQHQPPPPAGAQALMQTLVPCVQSPVYPAPPPPPPPPQPQHQQPQSFVPSHQQQHHQHHQQHSSHHHPSSHHSSRQQQHHHQQSHNHPHHHQSHNQPRFLTVASSTAAAAAAAAQQQQQAQQQQHQLLFAAAAAAMAMSNNYSNFAGTTATSSSNTRFLKGTGRGSGGGAGVHHGPVTGVVRRGRNYGGGTNKQQQNSSK